MLQSVLNSGCSIDKLVMVMNQDVHTVATAGILITTLSRARAASLVAGGEFIINRYNPAVSMTGYLSASQAALPYLINRGRFASEYDSLRNKIIPD